METPEVVAAPETPAVIADPSISDLRKMLSEDAAPESEATPEPVVPEAEAKVEPEKAEAESGTVDKQEPEKKSESALDRRFSKLAKQRDEARREAETLRRELAAKTPPGPVEQVVQPPVVDSTKPLPPDPATFTGTWEQLEKLKLDYVEQLTDWKVGERERAKQTEQLQVQAKTLHTTWEAKSKTFAESNPEFEDAIGNIGPMVTRAGVADLIKESPVGPEMVLYLHQNPAEVTRMGACKTQVALARELGKLEAQLSTPVTPTPTPAAKKPLPKPPASVGGGQPATVDLDKCDMRSFRREVGKLCTRD